MSPFEPFETESNNLLGLTCVVTFSLNICSNKLLSIIDKFFTLLLYRSLPFSVRSSCFIPDMNAFIAALKYLHNMSSLVLFASFSANFVACYKNFRLHISFCAFCYFSSSLYSCKYSIATIAFTFSHFIPAKLQCSFAIISTIADFLIAYI